MQALNALPRNYADEFSGLDLQLERELVAQRLTLQRPHS